MAVTFRWRSLLELGNRFPHGTEVQLIFQGDAKIFRVRKHSSERLRENDFEQTTVTDLVQKMSMISSGPYSPKYMHQKDFGASVVITNINGRVNVVTFRAAAAHIIQDIHDTPKMDSE